MQSAWSVATELPETDPWWGGSPHGLVTFLESNMNNGMYRSCPSLLPFIALGPSCACKSDWLYQWFGLRWARDGVMSMRSIFRRERAALWCGDEVKVQKLSLLSRSQRQIDREWGGGSLGYMLGYRDTVRTGGYNATLLQYTLSFCWALV